MVRLETPYLLGQGLAMSGFTFQYGQIRNNAFNLSHNHYTTNLHSSMVRLETIPDRTKR